MLGQAFACSAVVADEPPPAAASRPRIGDAVGDLKFTDIRYLTRSLRDLGDRRVVVLVFTNTACPLVQKYWPKLKRLDAEYRERGVQFVSVNVSDEDETQDVAQQGIDYGVEFPLVKDVDGHCVRATGVERTPEVVVLDAQRRLRYRGRIDDQVRLGGVRPMLGSDDLRRAIDDVLAGRAAEVAETTVEGCLITPPRREPLDDKLTFHEHVAPILKQHCQECHRDGAEAPFSLVKYEQVAAQGAMIAEVVAQRRMPPWFAHRRHAFANERGLTSAERDLLTNWVRGGMKRGDESAGPSPLAPRTSKWEIGEPDVVTTTLESHSLPADGFVDYRYTVLPYVFLRDTWISAAEILPSNPRVVHHCNLAFWKLGESFDQGNFITGRVPGGTALSLDDGIALKIPRGSILGVQIHYTTTGKPETNRMSVGLRYPRAVVQKQLRHVQVTTSRFLIPPGAAAHAVTARRTLPCNATGLGMFSHMHLRGKDMTFVAHRPDAEQETLLSIPNYHYGWQQNYRWGPGVKKFPKGTHIEVTAHYDNSPFNPFNPDATVAVKPGPQTIHEMMFGFFFYTDDDERLELHIDPKTGAALAAEQAR